MSPSMIIISLPDTLGTPGKIETHSIANIATILDISRCKEYVIRNVFSQIKGTNDPNKR